MEELLVTGRHNELIDPALGRHVPTPQDLARSVARILEAAPGTEAVLANLNYLKLANELRIAVGQLQGSLDGEPARVALSELAGALLGGVLDIAGRFRAVFDRPVRSVPIMRGRTVVNFFHEPSTRTRISFELAEKRLSADIVNHEFGHAVLDGIRPLFNETISVESAIRALTSEAAWQLFSDHEVGSREVGKLADLVILEKDPRKVAPDTIKNIKVMETWMDGKQVYRV